MPQSSQSALPSSSQRNSSVTWTTAEVERLIGWMEENLEELRGKQITWHKLAKEQVFPNDDHITVKKIGGKAINMKRSWKGATTCSRVPTC